MSKKLFSLLLCFVLGMGAAFAQTRTVSGTVTDASNGEPLYDATVLLKGSTSTYTQTDNLGNFKITVPGNGVLVVSLMSYESQEVAIDGRTQINIALKPDAQFLEDAIVVAYGTVRREANTGSVSSVKSDQLASVPATSVDKMLSGKMAGVSITSGSGQPGSTSTIRVRGTSSINAGNDPLWVIDGIPVETGDQSYFTNTSNAMSAINPNDI